MIIRETVDLLWKFYKQKDFESLVLSFEKTIFAVLRHRFRYVNQSAESPWTELSQVMYFV